MALPVVAAGMIGMLCAGTLLILELIAMENNILAIFIHHQLMQAPQECHEHGGEWMWGGIDHSVGTWVVMHYLTVQMLMVYRDEAEWALSQGIRVDEDW